MPDEPSDIPALLNMLRAGTAHLTAMAMTINLLELVASLEEIEGLAVFPPR
jgi:hypothetical protein